MEFELIKDWLVPVSTSVTLIVTSIGGWLSLREYRLKAQADVRLSNSAELESDIKLITLFIKIMDIAHARNGTHVSEKAIEKILTPEILEKFALSGTQLKDILQNTVINLPVGAAAQDAAIAAIWTLGQRHEILTPIAIQALESLSKFKSKVASGYLRDMKAKYSGEVLAVAG